MKWFTNKCDLIFVPTPGMQNRIRENGTEVSMAVLPTGLDDSFYIEDEEKTKTIRRQYLGKRKTDIYSVPSQGWRKKKSDISPEWNPVFERDAAIFVSCVASG